MLFKPVLKLIAKIILLFSPIIILSIFFVQKIQTPIDTKLELLEDKINRLIVLNPQKNDVIFAGESRGEMDLWPQVFKETTKLDAVNVSVGHGSLNEVFDSFSRNDILNKHRVIIISVGSYEINDYYIDDQRNNLDYFYSLPIGSKKKDYFFRYVGRQESYYANHFNKFIRLVPLIESRMDDGVFIDRGYVRNNQQLQPDILPEVDDHNPWYESVITDGIKQTDFIRAIDGFGHNNDTVVLMIGPISPAWRSSLSQTQAVAIERSFIEIIRTHIRGYPNMHFIDFSGVSNTPPPLLNKDFGDEVHLNVEGARKFTLYFGATLREQGLLGAVK